jgi:hypothetical protein
VRAASAPTGLLTVAVGTAFPGTVLRTRHRTRDHRPGLRPDHARLIADLSPEPLTRRGWR